MVQLTDSQESLLLKIKQRGPQSARQLADQLGMTTMGVRQHLAALEQKGLVAEGAEQKQQRGRPVRPWKLTGQGHQQFPDSHSQVSVELIASVRDTFGETGLDKLIDHRTAQMGQQYRDVMAGLKTLGARVKKLAQIRTGEGYMAEAEKVSNSEWLLVENHCPICAAASACQGFCRSELDLFRQALGEEASVERVDHILAGARRCAYKIVEKGA